MEEKIVTLDVLIKAAIECKTDDQLAVLAGCLEGFLEFEDNKKLLDNWLATNPVRSEKGFAVFVENAAIYGLSSAAKYLTDQLCNDEADPLIHSIAAQRIRLVPQPELMPFKKRAREALVPKVKNWFKTNQDLFSITAISIAAVGMDESEIILMICDWIRNAPDKEASTAAVVLMEWGCYGMGLENRLAAYDALIARYNESRGKEPSMLGANIVWALGSVSDHSKHKNVVHLMAKAFVEGHGVEDAAALRAVKLLKQQWGKELTEIALDEAFASYPDKYNSFKDCLNRLP